MMGMMQRSRRDSESERKQGQKSLICGLRRPQSDWGAHSLSESVITIACDRLWTPSLLKVIDS